ncbi:MAG: c-type cytochrome, partial [Cyclobacteriaceae bacterium]
DPENDPLHYTWDMGNGDTLQTEKPEVSYTYQSVGDYDIVLRASDPENLSAESQLVNVYAGNQAPQINIEVMGNNSFYFPGEEVSYEVSVEDPDDPSAGEDLSSLYIAADYIEGYDKAEAAMGHQVMTDAMAGKSIMESLTCKTCHKTNEKSIGPAYTEVAEKYKGDRKAVDHLVNKIINGGSGIWGETMMPANPDLKEADARKIVAWVLSLEDMENQVPSLPSSGKINPTLDKVPADNGIFILSASFTDKGGENIKPLSTNKTIYLRNSKIDLNEIDRIHAFNYISVEGNQVLLAPKGIGYFALDNVDLTGISSVNIQVDSGKKFDFGYQLEVRAGGIEGEILGQTVIRSNALAVDESPKDILISLKESEVEGKQDLFIITQALNEEETVEMVVLSMQMN